MHDDGYFDEPVAAIYDRDEEMFAAAVVDPVVDCLADLAAEGAALEFGVGTGRIALPLSARGVPVHGIDLSKAMLARLEAKPGADQVPCTVGDFATTRVEGHFSLVYLVFNTINNLVTQDAQVACFANAAHHLQPGGAFVIEVGVPRLQDLPSGQSTVVFSLSDSHWGIDEYDVVDQGLVSHHLRVVDGQLHRISTPFRYVWPAELDLMARLAGMSFESRWSDWARTPFGKDSSSHVSVWRKPA